MKTFDTQDTPVVFGYAVQPDSRLDKSGSAWKKVVVCTWEKVVVLGKKWSRLENNGRFFGRPTRTLPDDENLR